MKTPLHEFLRRIEAIEKAERSHEFVTISSLLTEFENDPNWKPLTLRNSDLTMFLTSSLFKFGGQTGNNVQLSRISTKILKLFALLHCPSTGKEKIECFFRLMKGIEPKKAGIIQRDDQDLNVILKEIGSLVSWGLIQTT